MSKRQLVWQVFITVVLFNKSLSYTVHMTNSRYWRSMPHNTGGGVPRIILKDEVRYMAHVDLEACYLLL